MAATAPEVWIAAADAGDIIRAESIVAVRLDSDGSLSARVRDEAKATVTLVEHRPGAPVPADFHRQLLRAVAELADSSGAQLVTAEHGEHGWLWVAEPL